MILNVEVDYNIDRVFSFINPEHQVEYSHIKEHCKKKAALSKELSKCEIVDGVVLNFMFKNMGYGKDYDMVEAIFPLVDEKDGKSRLGMMREYQLCVKNPDKVKSIRDCTQEFKLENYQMKLQTINKYRTIYSRQTKYFTDTGRIKNGKT